MLKKFAGMALAALVGLSLIPGGAAQAKGFRNLSFNGGYTPKHPTVVQVWDPFFQAAEAKFPGKNGLSFHYFATNELFPEAESMNALTDGRVDFGRVRPSLFPGNMNLLSAVEIPGMCSSATVGSLVTQDLIDKFPEVRSELPPNSVPFTSWASATYQLHTLKPVKTLAEMNGLKLIVWDATTLEIVKALGGNPIRMTSTDTYLALSKGMADGVFCPLAPVRSFKISESTRYHLFLNLGVTTFAINVHKPLWDEMPQDMRDWLKEEGGLNMALKCGRSLDDGAAEDTEWMRAQGHEFYHLSEGDHAEMLVRLEPFAEKWRTETCRGMDPAVVDKVLKFTRERSRYHTEQLKAEAGR